MMTLQKWLLAIIALAALAIGVAISWSLSSTDSPSAKHDINGLMWPQTRQLNAFELVSKQGDAFTLANLQGKWSLVFFGYTHCPDICPITLSTLKEVKQQLAEKYADDTGDTQYVFISVDGQRDTPETLLQYINYFDPAFLAATGDKSQIESLTKQLGIIYYPIPGKTEENYLVDHSSSILLIDPKGRLIALFSVPHVANDIAERYAQMRQYLKTVM